MVIDILWSSCIWARPFWDWLVSLKDTKMEYMTKSRNRPTVMATINSISVMPRLRRREARVLRWVFMAAPPFDKTRC